MRDSPSRTIFILQLLYLLQTFSAKALFGIALRKISTSNITEFNPRTLTLSGILRLAEKLRTATRTNFILHSFTLYTLHSTPYALHPTPYTLRPTLQHNMQIAGMRDLCTRLAYPTTFLIHTRINTHKVCTRQMNRFAIFGDCPCYVK